MALVIHLGPIAPEVFTPFLNNAFASHRITKGDQLAGEILSFTGGHPYYTQLMAQQAILLHGANRKGSLSFDAILEESLLLENDYLEKLWEPLVGNRQEKAVILALAEGVESLYGTLDRKRINVSRSLKQLTGSGLITAASPPAITDPLFRIWLRRRVLKME